MDVRKSVSSIFKLNGLAIRSDAINYMCRLLEPINEEDHEEWIEKIIESIQKMTLISTLITQDVIKKAAINISKDESDDVEVLLQTIDIFKLRRLEYNVERKKFILASKEYNIHGEADEKNQLIKNRYTIAYQRTVHHKLFRPTVANPNCDKSNNYCLTKIEYLLGLSSQKIDVIVLGLLTQLVEGEFHLEDDTGLVKLNLSKTSFHIGLFPFNSFILLEGWFEDGILHATTIGQPPAESAETTRSLLDNINYFGGQNTVCQKYNKLLQEKENENSTAMIVFLSDIWLDKPQVMEKLENLFEGYTDTPPVAFVLCGNFLSGSSDINQIDEMHSRFNALADLICKYPQLLNNTKFIIVPGPNDPGPGKIYPRPPFFSCITRGLKTKVPNMEFASNPCRLTYCTQEIVIFREDTFTKMCRNTIYFPDNSTNITSHFARSIISQAHLSPLPLHSVPIYWSLDHCLSLHPTPDLIVVADKGKPFTEKFNSSIVANPGSFMKTDFSFKVYFPATKELEESQILGKI